MKNRVAKLESNAPYKQKKIQFVVGQDLPRKLADDVFYIQIISTRSDRLQLTTDDKTVARIEYLPYTREEIEQSIREAGFDPKKVALDE